MRLGRAASVLLLGACQAATEYGSTFYTCASGECPAGYVCGVDDRCVQVMALGEDAASPRADASETLVPIDAPPVPVLDGAPVLTATFGERPGSDHQGVTMDTFLDQGAPDQNNGSHNDFHLTFGTSEQNGLLYFDLTALPSDAVVIAADLSIWTDADPESPHDATTRVRVYRVLEQWQEGAEEFTTGQASWNERLLGVAWTTPGCGAPGSRDGTPIGETTLDAVATQFHIAISSAVVEEWVRDWSTNHGFLLRAEGTGSDYGWGTTREFEPADMRPELEVTYQLP